MMNQNLYSCSTADFHDYDSPEQQLLKRLKIQAKWNAGRLVDQVIPPLYRESNVDRLNQKMLAACQAWTIGSLGLGLVGKTGLGKTRCVYRRIEELIRNVEIKSVSVPAGHRIEGFFAIPRIEAINEAALAKLVMASLDFDDSTGAGRRLKALHSADVLFIDDIGQAKISERVGAELYEIIEGRTSNLKPIIFTSNFGGARLAEKFTDTVRGDAVVRRLKEFCTVVVEDAG